MGAFSLIVVINLLNRFTMEDLLDTLDGGLSHYIANEAFDDVHSLLDALENFNIECRSDDSCNELVLNEKDFLDTLISFLRASVDDKSTDVFSVSKKVLQCLCKIFKKCAQSNKMQLVEVADGSNLENVLESILNRDDNLQRLAIELCCRACQLKNKEIDKQKFLNQLDDKFLSLVEKYEGKSNDDASEIRNYWNSFLVLDAKERYGELISRSAFVQTMTNVFNGRLKTDVSIEDLCYVTENALVSSLFRESVLKNYEFLDGLVTFFHKSFEAGQVEVLRHLVVILRNLFFDLSIEDKRKWVTYEHAHSIVKNSKVTEDLQQLILDSASPALRFFALELGSYNFVDLDETQNAVIVEKLCNDIVQWLIKAAQSSEKSINIPETEYNTSAYNLVSLIARVSYNDEVKIACVKHGVFEKLLQFLQEPMAPKILVEVLTIYDQICFVQADVEICRNSVNELKEVVNFLSGVKQDLNAKYDWLKGVKIDDQVQNAAKGVTQGLAMSEPVVATTETKVMVSEGSQTLPETYIMLSYNWESKEVVKSLITTIRQSGFEVWVDDEQMLGYGDINDGMADAVENCKLMVAVVSEKYKLSKNCRRELEYADNKNKPFVIVKKDAGYEPNGWLGLMMGKKLYHCLDPNNLQQSCEDVVDAIRTNVKKSSTGDQMIASKSEGTSTASGTSSSNVSKPARVMSHDEYKKWVKNNSPVKFLRKDSKSKKTFNEFVIAAIVDQIKSEPQTTVIEKLQNDFSLSASNAMTLIKVLETNYSCAF